MTTFKKLYEDEHFTPFTVQREMIDLQENDPDIEKIIDLYSQLGFRKSDDDPIQSLKVSDIRATNEKVSKIIKNRFGMNLEVLDVSYTGGMTLPIILNINNILGGDIYDKVETILEVSEDKSIDENEKLTGIKSYDDLAVTGKNHYLNLKRALMDKRLNNVEVDLKKAKVLNLPDIYKGYIGINSRFYAGIGMTAREVVAVLIHEVGHNFNIIEASYRAVQNTTVLLDALRTEVGVKGKSPRQAVKLAYEKIFGETVPSNANVEDILASWQEQFARSVEFGSSSYHKTDDEQLADQFASRMGLGEALASGMHKRRDMVASNIDEIPIVTLELGGLSIAAGLGIFAILKATLGLVIAPAIVGIFAGLEIMRQLYNRTGDTEVGTGLTYDTLYQRFTRIKLDTIRMIRSIPNLDPKYRNSLVESVENIDIMLKDIPKPRISILNKIWRMLSSRDQRIFDMKRSQQLMEDLNENELHVANAKLQKFI